jgi:hypothetical protein
MDALTRLLAGLLRGSVRLLPAGRRQWAEALWAEAVEVPAGWPRLLWLCDGLWLIVREVAMARKIVYRLGIAVVMVAVAAGVLASWRGVPHGDSENSVDKLRVAVLALALVALPWVARRRGVFGPAADSVTARLVRTGGCTALCALIWVVVQIDRIPRNQTGFIIRGSWGDGGNVGNGQPVDWATEIVVLALIIGCAVALKVVRVWHPEMEEAMMWMTWVFLGIILLAVVLDQMIITLYAAGIYAMTARRTQVTPAALGLGAGAGVVGSGLVYAVTAAAGVPGHGLILPVAMLGPLAAGFEAARRAPGTGSPEEQRQARTWQGLAAGVVGGGAVALLTMILTGEVIVLLFIPLVGLLFGTIGGTLGAACPRKPRPARAWSGGLFVLH